MNDLTITENDRLLKLESTIEKNLKAFYEVGRALLEIRESRLYRKEFSTFEDYCRDRWDMGRTYSHYVIESAAVMDNVHNCEHKPTTESQTRPLTKLSPTLQREAWQKAVETAPKGKVTARHVQGVVAEIEGKREKTTVHEPENDNTEADTQKPKPKKPLPTTERNAAMPRVEPENSDPAQGERMRGVQKTPMEITNEDFNSSFKVLRRAIYKMKKGGDWHCSNNDGEWTNGMRGAVMTKLQNLLYIAAKQ